MNGDHEIQKYHLHCVEELGKLLRCLLIVQNQSAGFKLPAYFSKVERCGKDRYSMEQLTTLPREGNGVSAAQQSRLLSPHVLLQ